MAFPHRHPVSTSSPARPGKVSSSAPPGFRARVKNRPGVVDSRGFADTAGEDDTRPQNNGRLTGPPMQMGPGSGSMFADGRMPRGQAQGVAPRTPNYPQGGPGPMRVKGQPLGSVPMGTPSYPKTGPGPGRVSGQAQGTHPRGVPTATRMMADGGMGDPEPIGGMPDTDMSSPVGDTSEGGTPPAPGGDMPVISPQAVNYHDDEWECGMCQHMSPEGQCAVLQMQVSPKGACNAFQAGGGQPDQGMQPGMGDQNDEGTSGVPPLS